MIFRNALILGMASLLLLAGCSRTVQQSLSADLPGNLAKRPQPVSMVQRMVWILEPSSTLPVSAKATGFR